MPKKKGNLIFSASIFYQLIEDCADHFDQDVIHKGDLKPSDIYKYYQEHKDEINEDGKPRYPKLSESIIYKRKDVREFLDQINEIRRKRLESGILKDDKYIKEDFDWYKYFLGHRAQKDCGLENLGVMINEHRKQIRSLLNEIDILNKKLDSADKSKKACKKMLGASESHNKSLERQLESARSSEEKYKKLYEDMKFYISTQIKTFATMEDCSGTKVTPITSEYTKEHSYKGEEDGETPSLAELRKRYPKRGDNSEN